VEKSLGRDASPVEADAAWIGRRIDEGDLQAGIGGAESCGVAAGSGAQDHQINLTLSCHV
jgi:hypothetical protein